MTGPLIRLVILWSTFSLCNLNDMPRNIFFSFHLNKERPRTINNNNAALTKHVACGAAMLEVCAKEVKPYCCSAQTPNHIDPTSPSIKLIKMFRITFCQLSCHPSYIQSMEEIIGMIG